MIERTLGHYEILEKLGAGGMGEVYRARDTKLNRDVAIKILPDAFASDAERVARFTREAETLAALNHPHIAQIHGFEDASDVRALVMEFVDGEDLAQRIARGPIPVDEALAIATQIADALDAAHERGIIHRDLKPANIKLTPDGTVKILDFGLARAGGSGQAAGAGQDQLTNSPTFASPAHLRQGYGGQAVTGAGVILGTAGYMSPEQARGKAVDKRTDIWAFGCVLYEMLTGRQPFAGDNVTDIIAAVVKNDPDWSALPAATPPPIRALLKRCLERDPRKRVSDIAAALFALDTVDLIAPGSAPVDTPIARRPLWRGAMAIVTASLVGAAVASALAFLLRAVPVPPRVSRLQIKTSGANGLSVDGVTSDIAVTPDGSRLVYVGGNGTALFVRSLDRLDPTAVTGLRSPRDPFVSPDGQWVGFFERSAVRKVGIGGGTPVALTPLDGPPRGASWGPDDTIVFATGNETTGLRRVSAAGGEPDVLTRPDRARGEADHVWPEFLPGGGSVLFTIVPTTGAVDQAQIAVLDLQTRASRVLMSGGSFARYVRSGHLVYVAGGTLYAVPFDLPRLAVSGSPVPVVPQMATTPQGAADVAIARDGTMVYVPGDAAAFARTLVWVDRRGQETAIPVPPRAYDHLRVAPDGQRVAVYVADQQSDIWLWTFDRATLTRVTFDPGIDRCPVWLRDSGRIVFRSRQAGALDNIFVQSADGTGTAERLTDTPRPHTPTSMSPDGDRLVFTEGPAANENIMQLTLAGRAVTPLVQTPFAERNGEISRDGRWLAYESNASGQFEIYVRPFPDVNRGQWQVSTGGGTRPLWARSGQELFFLAASSALMRVGVERGSTWRATKPVQLFERRYYLGSLGNTDRSYDISPDGQHFLMIKQTDGSESPMLVVVQHWDEELKRLAPVK